MTPAAPETSPQSPPWPGADARRADWEATQRRLWGGRPRDWADLAEPQNIGLFAAALDAVETGPGTRLLDIGCGSGLALAMAAQRGATVAGIDISPALLAIARERVPAADLREGGLDRLPFADGAFDAVLSINAVQFAADPPAALREVHRVLGSGGRVAIALFAAPERCESTALHLAMEALVPADHHDDHAPYALSAAGALEGALAAAGLTIVSDGERPGTWEYADEDQALRGLLCSGGGARAVAIAGEPAVREAIAAALAPFRRGDGSFAMLNHFRLVVARK